VREGGEAVRGADWLAAGIIIFLLLRVFILEQQLELLKKAMTHLATAMFMLTGKPPEKP
jgi:hypothetical protein